MTPNSPEDLFHAEKARSQSERGSTHAQLLSEAKAAFDKLMAEGQAARKSGRPRKNPLPPLMAVMPAAPVVAKKTAAKKTPSKVAKKSAKKPTKPKPAKKAAKTAAKKPASHKPARKSAAGKSPAKKAAKRGNRR